MNNYFFDSYAILEVINNNKSYEKYFNLPIITTSHNVAEVYYSLLRSYNKKTADYWINNLNIELINFIGLDIVTRASIFKLENKKENLSYIDCIGYIISLKYNMKFLTGDEKFEKKKNVEFVK